MIDKTIEDMTLVDLDKNKEYILSLQQQIKILYKLIENLKERISALEKQIGGK